MQQVKSLRSVRYSTSQAPALYLLTRWPVQLGTLLQASELYVHPINRHSAKQSRLFTAFSLHQARQ